MAKGSGKIRTPSRQKSFSARITGPYEERFAKYDRLHKQLGSSWLLPVYESEAKEYEAKTGGVLPDKAVRVVLGRGGANGEDFTATLSMSEYRHIKTFDFKDSFGKSNTYISDYNGLDELKKFIEDVKERQKINRFRRIQKQWNKR